MVKQLFSLRILHMQLKSEAFACASVHQVHQVHQVDKMVDKKRIIGKNGGMRS
jgi:hypothetical protein